MWSWLAQRLEAAGFNCGEAFAVPYVALAWEPGLCLVLGVVLLCLKVSPIFGGFLCVSSVALFSRALVIRNRVLTIKRDNADAGIMSAWLMTLGKGKTNQEQKRWYTVRLAVPAVNEEEAEAIRQPVSGWDPVEPPVEPEVEAEPENPEYLLLKCPNAKCKEKFKLHRRHIGRVGRCKKCATAVPVTAPA